ncbi:MAG: hypothetical protein A3E82_06875 [Gammaproteobacteria bacterium RIFCSPHIGHO2_12_FULL_38_11]|nr:MAG: hypothetical protein A3E82_06875 [Gammaproteobacteria bacterium RIFCSPHIGHO2_12_FULL_38_11]
MTISTDDLTNATEMRENTLKNAYAILSSSKTWLANNYGVKLSPDEQAAIHEAKKTVEKNRPVITSSSKPNKFTFFPPAIYNIEFPIYEQSKSIQAKK